MSSQPTAEDVADETIEFLTILLGDCDAGAHNFSWLRGDVMFSHHDGYDRQVIMVGWYWRPEFTMIGNWCAEQDVDIQYVDRQGRPIAATLEAARAFATEGEG